MERLTGRFLHYFLNLCLSWCTIKLACSLSKEPLVYAARQSFVVQSTICNPTNFLRAIVAAQNKGTLGHDLPLYHFRLCSYFVFYHENVLVSNPKVHSAAGFHRTH